MAGTTLTSQLTCGFATDADDAGLRVLLRETPIGGAIRLSFEREPSYFASVRREGSRHYTVCAREAGQIVAMASRTVWPTGVGYLHQLRIAPSHRHLTRQFLRVGFRMLRESHAADEAPYDVTTIVSDNHVARRVLEAGLPGLPVYRPIEKIVTLLLPARAGFGARDLREHKQVVVRGYDSIWAQLWLRLPVGSVLPIAYADGSGNVPADCRWVVLALPASHPQLSELRRRYRPRVYESQLYVVHEPGAPFDGPVRWEVAWL
ncbi:MAG: hypothetical protein PCFJNLEI_03918 [Verrucomicrobiae bacterium]|nr:hypothetical protein [Verrucomicrobiae bacterium]